jgi:1,2-diacylglycerol 3-beta-galactosyltransferase
MYMELSDFFIGKPGPGSISEALAKQLPVIVQRNAWTMKHEMYNTVWLEEIGAGIVAGNFSRDIAGAVQKLLEPAHYARYRDRAAAVQNTAVYEIPGILESVLDEVSALRPCASPEALSSPKYNSTPAGTQIQSQPRTA